MKMLANLVLTLAVTVALLLLIAHVPAAVGFTVFFVLVGCTVLYLREGPVC